MNRKFTLLKVITGLDAAVLLIYMAILIMALPRNTQNKGVSFFLINELILIIFLSHCLLIYHIFRKHYPNIEIAKSTLIYYRISAIGSWIGVGFLTFALIGLAFVESDSASLSKRGQSINDFFFIVLIFMVLLVTQLIGAGRLIRAINTNAREQLENSFN